MTNNGDGHDVMRILITIIFALILMENIQNKLSICEYVNVHMCVRACMHI